MYTVHVCAYPPHPGSLWWEPIRCLYSDKVDIVRVGREIRLRMELYLARPCNGWARQKFKEFVVELSSSAAADDTEHWVVHLPSDAITLLWWWLQGRCTTPLTEHMDCGIAERQSSLCSRAVAVNRDGRENDTCFTVIIKPASSVWCAW